VRTINANKVKPEVRDALLWVQEQFDRVLHAWVTGSEMPVSPASQGLRPENVTDIGTQLAQAVNAFFQALTAAITQHQTLTAAITQQVTENVVAEVRGLLSEPQRLVAETNATVKGATRIEVAVPVHVPVVERGHVYADRYNSKLLMAAFDEGEAGEWGNISNLPELLSKGWAAFNIGQSGRKPGARQKEHPGKNRIGKGETVKRVYTDDPGKLESLIHARCASGVVQIRGTKDLFLVPPWHIAKILDWREYITYTDAQMRFSGWVCDEESESKAA
jgi:hypothetical protein